MVYQIGDCSPEAQKRIVSMVDTVGINDETTSSTKYPFGKLLIGKAFIVPFESTSEQNMRRLASLYGRMFTKTFTVIKHNAHNCYEVARIA